MPGAIALIGTTDPFRWEIFIREYSLPGWMERQRRTAANPSGSEKEEQKWSGSVRLPINARIWTR